MSEELNVWRDAYRAWLGENFNGGRNQAAAAVIRDYGDRRDADAYQCGKLEGARLALEAAANGLEAYAKAYTEQKERAKADKDRKAARDFESMAMTCAFRSTEIRALDPAKIVGEG